MPLKLALWTDSDPRARHFREELAQDLADLLCLDATKRPWARLGPELRMQRTLLRYSLGVRAVAIRQVLHRMWRAH